MARKGTDSSQRLGRHRWSIERTMAWLAGCPRLHRRYERKASHFLAFTSTACTGFLEEKRRTPGHRGMGPVALGTRFSHICVVVSKQGCSRRDLEKLVKLKPLAEGENGMLASAFAELTDLGWRENARAKVLGPGSSMPAPVIPPLRPPPAEGGHGALPPHKDLLLGEMWWHDEDALGGVADVLGFRPDRLWVGSERHPPVQEPPGVRDVAPTTRRPWKPRRHSWSS